MALNIEGKKLVVEEVSAVVAEAGSMVAAEYRGLTVEQMTQLRASARAAGVKVLQKVFLQDFFYFLTLCD